jgi:soluble lytic murein transglycosylase-like protein
MDSADIQNLIISTATAMGINPALALEVAITESSLNQNAVGAAGEIGLFQLMPATAAQLGVSNPYDPTQNTQGGCMYLSQLLAMFGGDESQALAAYNWGMGNVQNAVAEYGSNWLQAAPSSTQTYVSNILNAVGTQYTVSAGTTAAAAPAPSITSDTTVDEAGIGVGTTLGVGAIALLVGAGLFLVWLMQE